jgi:hypothetical protein
VSAAPSGARGRAGNTVKWANTLSHNDLGRSGSPSERRAEIQSGRDEIRFRRDEIRFRRDEIRFRRDEIRFRRDET